MAQWMPCAIIMCLFYTVFSVSALDSHTVPISGATPSAQVKAVACSAQTVIDAFIANNASVCYGDIGVKNFVPHSSLNITDCDAGYYCPNVCPGINGGEPQICMASQQCMIDRLGSQYCPPQGIFEPELCPPGYYCPEPRTMLPCTEGQYCPRGSSSPNECPAFSYCPPLTQMKRYYGGIVISLLTDLLMAGLFFLCKYKVEPARWRARKAKKARLDAGGAAGGSEEYEMSAGLLSARSAGTEGEEGDYDSLSSGVGVVSPRSLGLPRAASKAVLEEGFRRCNAGLRLDMSFDNLTYTLPAPYSKTILAGVTGAIRSGRVTAIMGPSGAGKTTFLSVLMGKYAKTAGTLYINGAPDEMHRYKKMTGFVPQDDTMLSELTVRENILYSARVRLPRSMNDRAIQRHVDAIIDVLGLGECCDAIASTVSGGQRKRTNIGMELAAAPAAIFLDEPTSGLDATAALEVCSTLKAVADLGLTVVSVIHQPRQEIFRSFDDLLLLAPGGLTVFMGPQRLAVPYFRDHLGVTFSEGGNPADDLLDYVGGRAPGGSGPARIPSRLMSDAADGEASPDTSSALSTPLVTSPGASPSVKPPTRASKFIAVRLSDAWGKEGPAVLAAIQAAAGMAVGGSASDIIALATAAAAASSGSSSSSSTASPRTVGSLQGHSISVASSVGGLHLPNGAHAIGGNGHGNDGPMAAAFDPNVVNADRGATWLRQFYLVHNRSVLQQYRQITSYALEVGVAGLAGAMMGAAATVVDELYKGILQPPYTFLSPSPMETLLPSIALYVALAVGIAASPAGVRTFGEERAVYFREASSGHSKSAYYAAKTLSMLYRFTLGALHFASIFCILAKPAMPFSTMYLIVWLDYFAIYGLAAITSMLVKRENSALLGVIFSLIAGCMCGYGPNLHQGASWGVLWLMDLSYARWTSEAFFHSETLPYRDKYMVETVSANFFGYTMNRMAFDVGMVVLLGVGYRAVAFLLMIGLNRDKQK